MIISFLPADFQLARIPGMLLADSSWLGLMTLDWVVLAVYLVLILLIGLWSLRHVHDTSDFFLGGRRFGKILMAFFAYGSEISHEKADTVVSASWRVGLAGIWWSFLWVWITPFYWTIAPVLRRTRALTTADLFQARFGGSTALLYSLYGILMSIVILAGVLFGSGKMVDELTGQEIDRAAQVWDIQIPVPKWNELDREIRIKHRRVQGYEFAILAIAGCVVISGMLGGLKAVIAAGFLQGLLGLVLSFLLLPLLLGRIGGFGELQSAGEVKPSLFNFGLTEEAAANITQTLGTEPLTWLYIATFSVAALLGTAALPHILAICGAGKTEVESRFGYTAGSFLKRLCVIAWTFTGLASIVWYLGSSSPLLHPDSPLPGTQEYQALSADERQRIAEDRTLHSQLKARASEDFQKATSGEQDRLNQIDRDFADRVFGRAAYDILPTIAPGLIGLFLASLIAVMMSAAATQMVVCSGLFTENIYKKYLAKNKSQRHYVWIGRISGLLIVILAIVMQTLFEDVKQALQYILDTPAILGVSLWLGIVWRGWTPVAVWVSVLFGGLAWAACVFFPQQLREWGLPEILYHSDGEMLHAWRIVFYLSAGVLSGLIASLFTRRVREDRLDAFFLLIHTPVKPGEIVKASCTLPDDPLPPREKLFNIKDIEIAKPTLVGVGGFIACWVCVGLLVWMTSLLSRMM